MQSKTENTVAMTTTENLPAKRGFGRLQRTRIMTTRKPHTLPRINFRLSLLSGAGEM